MDVSNRTSNIALLWFKPARPGPGELAWRGPVKHKTLVQQITQSPTVAMFVYNKPDGRPVVEATGDGNKTQQALSGGSGYWFYILASSICGTIPCRRLEGVPAAAMLLGRV